MSTTTNPIHPHTHLSYERKTHQKALSARIMHPDILLPILSFLPATHLPPLLRTSRYLHALVGPILYSDLPIPPLTPSVLCPHLSPLGSLFLSPTSTPLSTSDLRAVLHDRPSRKRLLLESARTLRLQAGHVHEALPPIMRDLRLDMRRVDTLHLTGGYHICLPSSRGSCTTCPFYTHLRPHTVILESTHLSLSQVGGLSPEAHEGIQHLIIKLRPSNFGMYPPLPSHSLLSSVKRVTVVINPTTYLDKNGREVEEPWRPSSRSACGEYYWEDKPSFTELLEHLMVACDGIEAVEIVGAEAMSREWVRADEGVRGAIKLGGDEDGWLESIIKDVEERRDGGCGVTGRMRWSRLEKWKEGAAGSVLDPAPISSGIAGKGIGRRSLVGCSSQP